VSVFVVVVGGLVLAGILLLRPFWGPLTSWREALRGGADAALVPRPLKRRALNAPLMNAITSMVGWFLAGLFYLPYQLFVAGAPQQQAIRLFLAITLVGGPVASTLAFLMAEYQWRRAIPLFFPEGKLDRGGVLRVPILARLGVTFLVTAFLPPALMLIADLSLTGRFSGSLPADLRRLWDGLVRTQLYIVVVTGIGSLAMAWLVARMINRPVQALRRAMLDVAHGQLDVRVPVRSTDELGDLNDHFNRMVDDLKRAEIARELFGRYVSPAVAKQALERGITLGGELVRATAMFVDLRGFTALTERLAAARVVDLLNEFYAIVERVCEAEGGVLHQFLGDGVVVVFGGPLSPVPDHARRAVRAAIALQDALAERNAADGEPLQAGIGICTGDMIAGNVGAGGRITYTIVGDAVNQASRLQVKTRELGAPILITESTHQALGDASAFALEPMGEVSLKGIGKPVHVHAVHGMAGRMETARRSATRGE
jgi:class 3 adenylate cyclase